MHPLSLPEVYKWVERAGAMSIDVPGCPFVKAKLSPLTGGRDHQWLCLCWTGDHKESYALMFEEGLSGDISLLDDGRLNLVDHRGQEIVVTLFQAANFQNIACRAASSTPHICEELSAMIKSGRLNSDIAKRITDVASQHESDTEPVMGIGDLEVLLGEALDAMSIEQRLAWLERADVVQTLRVAAGE
jgi:hypothetical protein